MRKLGFLLVASSSVHGYSWTQIGRPGGWISSITFHPANAAEIWASGDDSAGLYRSADGGNSWTLFTNTPTNQSTYSLVIDPSNPANVYAPNHFGRGMLLTRDAGATWSEAGVGLPAPGSAGKEVYDTAVSPTDSSLVLVATAGGLFESTDSGNTFLPVASAIFGAETDFRAVAFSIDGTVVFAGSKGGGVYSSTDQGSNWALIMPVTSIAVASLAATSHNLYIGFENANLYRVSAPAYVAAGLTQINNGNGSGFFGPGIRLKLATASGGSASTDTIYVASGGFYESKDSGQTFTAKINGLQGNSLFTIAVNPMNSSNVAASTLGNGIFLTTDGGGNWAPSSNQGLFAGTSVGLAQDLQNPLHLMNADSAGTAAGSIGLSYETWNGGTTWTLIGNPAPGVNAFVYDIDPQNPSVILAGTFNSGAYQSTNGSAGPWTQVISKAVKIERFVRDKGNSQKVYALATGPNASPDAVAYYSADGGASFTERVLFVDNLASHPSNPGEAVGVSNDAYATQDSFATFASLGLKAFAPSEGGFTAAAFDPNSPSTVLVGGATAGLYVTHNYSASVSAVTWAKLSTPMQGTSIRDILIVPRSDGGGDWYVSTYGGSFSFNAQTTSGVFLSTDGGSNWTALSNGMFPCSIAWRFFQSAVDPTQFYGAMWSGGVLQLTDQAQD